VHEVWTGIERDHKLSGSTIADISIGVVLVVLLVVGSCIISWRMRKANMDTVHQSEDAWVKSDLSKVIIELDEASLKAQYSSFELPRTS
jgi:flagellar basal body-associated protein FliL